MLKEVDLVSRVASPQVMEALSVDCSRLREAVSHTKDLIHLKREERDKGLLKVIKGRSAVCLLFVELQVVKKEAAWTSCHLLFVTSPEGNVLSFSPDGSQSFEGWFQDLQLSVNECFENPESRTDVEIYLQRLTVSQAGGFTLWVAGRWTASHRFCPSGVPKVEGRRETSGPAERSAAERRQTGPPPAALRVQRLAEGAAGGGVHVQSPLPHPAETDGVAPR